MQIIPLLKRNEYTLSMLPMVDTKVDVAYSMYTLLPIRADSLTQHLALSPLYYACQ